MKLAETARVTAAAAGLEEATFVLLGGWAPSIPDPAAKVLVAEHALHHGWHAALWRERIPEAMGLVADPAPEGDPFERLSAIVDLVASDSESGTVERLVGVYLVLAETRLETYQALLGSASDASDGPVIRALTLILADQTRDLQAGLELLASLAVGSETTRGQVEAARRRLVGG